MKVLLTGGSGFTGRRVIPLLIERGHEVSALARTPRSARSVAALGAVAVRGDLDDPASLDGAFASSRVDALVNIASIGFGHAPVIIAAAEDAGIRRAVFVSTTAIFTTLDAGSRSVRLAAESAIMASSLDWTIVRPTMIFGTPDDRNMARLLRLLTRTRMIPLPDGGRRLQQPVHVDDLAVAIVNALERHVAIGRCYDIAGPEPLTFAEVVAQAGQAIGRSPKIVPVPGRPVVLALRAYEKVAHRPRIRSEQIERLGEDKAFDITEAARDLDHRPRPFAVAIREEAELLKVGAR
ncbi:MAG: SDR family oxidoreductase [Acidimicrobiia bacterium]